MVATQEKAYSVVCVDRKATSNAYSIDMDFCENSSAGHVWIERNTYTVSDSFYIFEYN